MNDYQWNLLKAWQCALMIEHLPIETMLNDISQAETLGPTLNPTLYRKNSEKMAQDERMLQALMEVKKVVVSLARENS